MFTKITIKSNNLDYAGVYSKEDIEEEMKEIGNEANGLNDWVEYLIDHVFSDVVDLSIGHALVAVGTLDAVEEIKIRGNDFWARIIKEK